MLAPGTWSLGFREDHKLFYLKTKCPGRYIELEGSN
jgi:hypothetical protein